MAIKQRHELIAGMRAVYGALVLGLGAVIAGSVEMIAVAAEQSDAPVRPAFSYFRDITEKNIFNPNRSRRRTHAQNQQVVPPAEAFSLVGIISYEKGTYVFFDATNESYRKVLRAGEKMGDFSIVEVKPDVVKLKTGDRMLDVKVGGRLQRDEEKGWQVTEPGEWSANTNTNVTASSGMFDGIPEGKAEILKKLMKQREEELK